MVFTSKLKIATRSILNIQFGQNMIRKIEEQHENTDFRILRLLKNHPDWSQRALSRELGVSLGGINYCLKALNKKGYVKIQNFKTSNNKRNYVYILTPKGIAQKAALTSRFLQRKMNEYNAIKEEINAILVEIEQEDEQTDIKYHTN